jgi:PAS domain S-box-containing protein
VTDSTTGGAPPSGSRRRSAIGLTREMPVTGTHLGVFLVRERSAFERYLVAIVATLLAIVASVLLGTMLGKVPFLLLWPAVLFSALIGGMGPAIVSSLLSVVFVHWMLAGRSDGQIGAGDAVPVIIFLVASVAMSSVANALRVARTRSEAASRELREVALVLDQQATELEQQLEESQVLQEELEQTSEELARRTREAEANGAFSRGILASITDPFVVHDGDWRFVYINEQASAIFSHSRHDFSDSLVGMSLWEAYPEIIGTEHERQMRRAAIERVPVTYEAYYAQAGTWSLMSCYPLPDGGLATQWRDITERRRAEENSRYFARASEVLGGSLDYETTLAELAQLVVPELAEWCTVHVIEHGGKARQVALAHVDPAMVRWADELNRRYPPDPDAPHGVPQVLRSGAPELYPAITEELLAAGAQDEEHRQLLMTLGLRSAIIVPLVAHGTVLGALSLLSGRAGRRYGENELALAQELARRAALAVENSLLHRAERLARVAADQANMVKMQFLAVMSHELRTPLNAIGGYAELLRLGLRGPVNEAQVRDLERIGSSQRSLLLLINDILNFAKVEAGEVPIRIEDVPLFPLITDLEDLVAPQLLAGGLRFDRDGCDLSIVARGDAEKIRQILLNLVGNALKFTRPGGSIAITTDGDADTVRIAVRDTGIGIAPARLESVFDPFVQLDRTLTSTHEGTGLGLAISRDLARAMKGDIAASSVPDVGSTFTLVLPAAR